MVEHNPYLIKKDLEKQKAILREEIKQHRLEAIQHREQIKMFMRQGVENLPEKQQKIYQELIQKEEALQKRLNELEE